MKQPDTEAGRARREVSWLLYNRTSLSGLNVDRLVDEFAAEARRPYVEALERIISEVQSTQAIEEMPNIPLNVEAALVQARRLLDGVKEDEGE